MIELSKSERKDIKVEINGRVYQRRVEARRLLSDFLREDCGLTGTHVGCEHGVCGACTVLVGGVAVRSCLIFAVQVDGQQIITVEGLDQDQWGVILQEEFSRWHALQCGFCTPGILMSSREFLSSHPDASKEDIKAMLSGHLCRCTGYSGIVQAVMSAAQRIKEESE
jgi:aerobic-type carbon monoxide dehydrogenase small subunit (CoxS/CutS family)